MIKVCDELKAIINLTSGMRFTKEIKAIIILQRPVVYEFFFSLSHFLRTNFQWHNDRVSEYSDFKGVYM